MNESQAKRWKIEENKKLLNCRAASSRRRKGSSRKITLHRDEVEKPHLICYRFVVMKLPSSRRRSVGLTTRITHCSKFSKAYKMRHILGLKEVCFGERRRDQESRLGRSCFEREKTLLRVSPFLFLRFGMRGGLVVVLQAWEKNLGSERRRLRTHQFPPLEFLISFFSCFILILGCTKPLLCFNFLI